MKEKEVIVCRCEDVTLEDINRLLEYGFTTLEEIKRVSRCGMGLCQGTTCFPLLAEAVARATGKAVRDLAIPTSRPPLKPVKLGAIAKKRTGGQRPAE